MSKQLAAVDLMRRFYQLVVNRPHREVVQWLLNSWLELEDVGRVVLVADGDGELSVRGTALGENNIIVLNSSLKRFTRIPAKAIEGCFSDGQLCVRDPHGEADQEFLHDPTMCSTALVPIGESAKPIGVLYLESFASVERLEALIARSQQLLVFCGLLLQHLDIAWKHQQQLEKARIAEQALWASEVYLRSILDHSPVFISVVDLDGNVILSSDHHLKDANMEPGASYNGHHVYALFPDDIAEALWQGRQSVTSQGSSESELSFINPDGEKQYYWMSRFPLLDQQGKIFASCAICTDITERKQAELAMQEQQKRLNHLAFHDELTGLPNRTLFQERLIHSLARARRSQTSVAIMLLDIDRFKHVNDSFGHLAGDELLCGIAERLVASVRQVDTVARLGGDEFVLVIEELKLPSDIDQVAQKVLDISSTPFVLQGHDITSTLSIGVSLFPENGEDPETLLKHADVAMYKAKDAGKNNYKLYDQEMNSKAIESLLIENDLRRAIKANELSLVYQPKIDLSNNSVVGLEALVRWNHQSKGVISPGEFIPLAEETGLIIPLGAWVLREACRQQKAWLDAGLGYGRVAVNLSPKQFLQADFPAFLKQLLAEEALDSAHLELEITENSAMDNPQQSILLLRRLHEMGVAMSVDDFGTGYSSLTYLKRFPIDTLKIDRSFIRDIHQDPNDAAIAKSIIDLGHNMGLNVVAEGVETRDQQQWLKRQGCDQAQGFLYSKPVAASELAAVLLEIESSFTGPVSNVLGMGI